jgi:hypothetical protein
MISWLRMMSLLEKYDGQIASATSYIEAAIGLAREIGSRRDVAVTLSGLAEVQFFAGETDAAIATSRSAVAMLGERSDRLASVHHVAGRLVSYLLAAGQYDEALPLTRRRLRIARSMGLRVECTLHIERLALLAALAGDAEGSAWLLGFADAYYVAKGGLRTSTARSVTDRARQVVEQALGAERMKMLLDEGSKASQGAAVDRALAGASGPA